MRRAILLLITVILAACSKPPPPEVDPGASGQPEAPVLKLSVLADGTILADGQVTPADQIGPLLAALAARRGVVWYYRAREASASDAALSITEQIVKNKLQVTLSTKPDFSDFIGPDGKPHPRRQ